MATIFKMKKKKNLLKNLHKLLDKNRLKDQHPITIVQGLTEQEWNDRVRRARLNEGFILEIGREIDEE